MRRNTRVGYLCYCFGYIYIYIYFVYSSKNILYIGAMSAGVWSRMPWGRSIFWVVGNSPYISILYMNSLFPMLIYFIIITGGGRSYFSLYHIKVVNPAQFERLALLSIGSCLSHSMHKWGMSVWCIIMLYNTLQPWLFLTLFANIQIVIDYDLGSQTISSLTDSPYFLAAWSLHHRDIRYLMCTTFIDGRSQWWSWPKCCHIYITIITWIKRQMSSMAILESATVQSCIVGFLQKR